MYHKLIVAALLILVLCEFSLAQSHQLIKGRIVNESGTPVPFASIKWMKDSLGMGKYFCIADRDGLYELNIHGENFGWIKISAVGYNPLKLHIHKNRDYSYFEIVLAKAVKELPPVNIKNRPGVEVSGDTTSYLADRFKKGYETTINELLANIPGFAVGSSGSVFYNGKRIDRVLINGDDLTGRDYSGLVSHLDVNGVEKLQLIRNYSDNSSLVSAYSGNRELALNISYKKNFLYRLFGTASIAAGIPLAYYEGRSQVTAFFDKFKVLSFQSINSVGNLNSSPGSKSETVGDINIDESYDVQLPQIDPVAGINDILISTDALQPFFKNKSAISSSNFLFRPTRKLSIRGRINYAYDKYMQRITEVLQYFNQASHFEIEEKKEIVKRLESLDGLISLNFLVNPKNQILLTLKSNNNWQNNNAYSAIIGSNSYTEIAMARRRAYAVKLIYNRLLKGNLAISTNFVYSTGQLPGTYTVLPPLFNEFFKVNTDFDNFNQVEKQQFNQFGGTVALTKKIKSHAYSFTFSTRLNNELLKNIIGFQSRQGDAFYTAADSVKNSKSQLSSITTSIQDAWKINKRFKLTYLLEMQRATNYLKRLNSSATIQELNKIWIFPGITGEYQLSEKEQFSFSCSMSSRYSNILEVANKLSVINLTSLYSGMDSLQMRLSQTASIAYSYSDLMKKRFLFFSNILFFRNPLLYLTRIQPYQNFTYSANAPSSRALHMLNVLVNTQKLSKDYKTEVFSFIIFSQGSNYLLIFNKEKKNKFWQTQIKFGFTTEINRMQLKMHVQYVINGQKSHEKFINKNGEASVQCNLKFSQNLFLNFHTQYNYLKPMNQSLADLWTTGIKLLSKSKNNKWDYGIRVANLFNQSEYTKAIISVTNSSVTSYSLMPRIITGSIKYKF